MTANTARILRASACAVVLSAALTSCSPLFEPFFEVRGDAVSAVSPSEDAVIDLTIENPLVVALRVSDIRATIVRVDAPNATRELPCSVADFSIEVPSGSVVVAPSDDGIALSDLGVPEKDWARVRLVESGRNQDGCVGATLDLAYSAVGSPAFG